MKVANFIMYFITCALAAAESASLRAASLYWHEVV